MDSGTPILILLLITSIGLGVILFLIKVTVPRIFKRVLDHYGHRLELAELIMNTRRAPTLWLTRQLEGLAQNPSPDRAARLQRQAVRISIKNLKAIIKFLSNANTYDTPETRHMVLKELNAIRREWEARGWPAVEPDPDYVLLRDREELEGETYITHDPAAGSEVESGKAI